MLTLLFGIFPIVLTLRTVIAITIYYSSFQLLTFHCYSFAHYKALWLSQVSIPPA